MEDIPRSTLEEEDTSLELAPSPSLGPSNVCYIYYFNN